MNGIYAIAFYKNMEVKEIQIAVSSFMCDGVAIFFRLLLKKSVIMSKLRWKNEFYSIVRMICI